MLILFTGLKYSRNLLLCIWFSIALCFHQFHDLFRMAQPKFSLWEKMNNSSMWPKKFWNLFPKIPKKLTLELWKFTCLARVILKFRDNVSYTLWSNFIVKSKMSILGSFFHIFIKQKVCIYSWDWNILCQISKSKKK